MNDNVTLLILGCAALLISGVLLQLPARARAVLFAVVMAAAAMAPYPTATVEPGWIIADAG